MKAFTTFRVAAALAVLFCAAHTLGGMLEQKSLGAASDAVFSAMKATHFDFNGADCTWYGFWFGFGLTVSAFLLLVAAVALTLDRVGAEAWPQVRPLAWALIAAMIANGLLAWRYFFLAPTLLSVAIAALLIIGTVRKGRARPATQA